MVLVAVLFNGGMSHVMRLPEYSTAIAHVLALEALVITIVLDVSLTGKNANMVFMSVVWNATVFEPNFMLLMFIPGCTPTITVFPIVALESRVIVRLVAPVALPVFAALN